MKRIAGILILILFFAACDLENGNDKSNKTEQDTNKAEKIVQDEKQNMPEEEFINPEKAEELPDKLITEMEEIHNEIDNLLND